MEPNWGHGKKPLVFYREISARSPTRQLINLCMQTDNLLVAPAFYFLSFALRILPYDSFEKNSTFAFVIAFFSDEA